MTVFLWQTSTTPEPESLAEASEMLTQSELDRAHRFRRPKHQNRFILSRAFLRKILAMHAQQHPAELRFQSEALGKPSLISTKPNSIWFSFSRSKNQAICTVSHDHEVGADLEYHAALSDLTQTAHTIFDSADFASWQSVAPSDQPDTFYRAWCRKEAMGKADGRGISIGPANLKVPLHAFPNQTTSVGHLSPESKWCLSDWSVAPKFSACIAIPPRIDSSTVSSYSDTVYASGEPAPSTIQSQFRIPTGCRLTVRQFNVTPTRSKKCNVAKGNRELA